MDYEFYFKPKLIL